MLLIRTMNRINLGKVSVLGFLITERAWEVIGLSFISMTKTKTIDR